MEFSTSEKKHFILYALHIILRILNLFQIILIGNDFCILFPVLMKRLIFRCLSGCLSEFRNLFISWSVSTFLPANYSFRHNANIRWYSSEIGAHVRSNLSLLNFSMLLFRPRAVTNRILFLRKNLVSFMRPQHVLSYHSI